MVRLENITVLCVLWEGSFEARKYIQPKYSVDWVQRLYNMVKRNLKVPFEFVCLSNVDSKRFKIKGVQHHQLRLPRLMPGWWAKVQMFRPDLPITPGRILYLDLDVLILRDLMPLVSIDSDIVICPAFGTAPERDPGEIYGYNSSVVAYNYPTELPIYETFMRDYLRWMKKYRGDQDFLKTAFPKLDTFPDIWIKKLGEFIRKDGAFDKTTLSKETRILLSMPYKNDRASEMYRYVRKIWQ